MLASRDRQLSARSLRPTCAGLSRPGQLLLLLLLLLNCCDCAPVPRMRRADQGRGCRRWAEVIQHQIGSACLGASPIALHVG